MLLTIMMTTAAVALCAAITSQSVGHESPVRVFGDHRASLPITKPFGYDATRNHCPKAPSR